VVNLDGAFGRASENLDVLRRVAGGVASAVQYGGGLRSVEAMETAISAGAGKLVLGTAAVEQPDLLRDALKRFGSGRIIVALDFSEGRVAARGWTVISDMLALDLARSLHQAGVREILATDIARDGMLSGPNLQALQELASAGPELLASGGISSASDVREIRMLAEPRITGVIVGKALYERSVTLPELIRAARVGKP
jgi:phosphoribosylformimino-5-aminoimidazole carboxamide ribotide isomerase